MESWSCISEGKGFVVSDETFSHTDSLSRSRNGLMGWELKIPCTFMESQGFGELGNLGLPEMVGKHLQSDSIRDVVSTSMSTPNLFSGEAESFSRISSSIVDSSSRDSSLIDLKLGRLADHKGVHSSKLSKGTPMLSSSESSTPTKRMRVSGVYSQPAYCQVYGCNKDLSSYKDYHKRHKVCEVHSKTAKVIVNGIEQRFCQQCSRFHLLGEFDDGKRSCRRRLAGHNERRRKPQIGSHPGRAGRFPQSFDGGRFEGNMLATASFICQEILPTDIPEKHGMGDCCRHVKFEGGTHYRPLSGMPVTNGHLHSKPVFPSYDIGKQYPSFHENGTNPLTASIFGQNGGQYPQDVRGLSSGSHSIFHETALGSQDFNVFNTASAVPGLSGISNSGCARSLLSSQSQNSSSYMSGIPIVRPLVIPASHKFPSSGMNSGSRSHLSPILLSNDCDDTNDFGISDGIIQGSGFANTKDRLPCQDGATIDLLQLSSQLQQVEDQRQSMQAKQENDAFCCLRIT